MEGPWRDNEVNFREYGGKRRDNGETLEGLWRENGGKKREKE